MVQIWYAVLPSWSTPEMALRGFTSRANSANLGARSVSRNQNRFWTTRRLAMLDCDEEVTREARSHATKPRLNDREACQYLAERHGVIRKPATLAKERVLGTGPEFEKFGRAVMYS